MEKEKGRELLRYLAHLVHRRDHILEQIAWVQKTIDLTKMEAEEVRHIKMLMFGLTVCKSSVEKEIIQVCKTLNISTSPESQDKR